MNAITLVASVLLVQHLAVVQLAMGAEKPKVLLISMDGFRNDYLTKADTPNFDKMVADGVTMKHLNNVFITKTFPNHYSLATGLYTESHGIVGNRMYDPDFDSYFTMSTKESRWWEGGEPIWITATKANLTAGVYFWPGSEVEIQGVRPREWHTYNQSVPFEERVKRVLQWMSSEDFDLGVAYFNEPDTSGHKYGPDDSGMVPVIKRMDRILGLLLDGMEEKYLTDKVNLIVTSDHGMTTVDLQNKVIDVSDYVDKTLLDSLIDYGPIAQMRPQPGKARELVNALSGIDHLSVMLKEDIPERFHLKNNRRVQPVFAMVEEGWLITDNVTKLRSRPYKGGHGYDNRLQNMKPIFIAKGPAFKSGKTVEPMSSLDIYPLICHLLDISPAPNNGSLGTAKNLLQKNDPNVALKMTLSSLVFFLTLVPVLGEIISPM